jgi:hypothetical protein
MTGKKPQNIGPAHLPEWLVVMNDNAGVQASEVAALFGFAHRRGLSSSIFNGSFPEPDFSVKFSSGKGRIKKNMWKKATIIAEIKRRQAIAKAQGDV